MHATKTPRTRHLLSLPALLLLVTLLLAACGAGATPTSSTAPVVFPVATTETTATTAAAATAIPADATVYGIVADRSEASYTVNETFANVATPVDAVGTTKQIAGQIALNADGTVAQGGTITVNVQSLTSDSDRRDSRIRTSALESDTYPQATFVITGTEGLSGPLTAAPTAFKLVGEMTIHGVTKPVTWDVTAALDGETLNGTATTTFKMGEFNITPPSVAVISVSDTVKLDMTITATQA